MTKKIYHSIDIYVNTDILLSFDFEVNTYLADIFRDPDKMFTTSIISGLRNILKQYNKCHFNIHTTIHLDILDYL